MLGPRTGSVALSVWLACSAAAAELPPVPSAHFNDYAGFVRPEVAQRLDARLGECERETGAQIVVAVFPKLAEQPLEAFTLRVAKAWAVGREGHDDGIVFFVFVQDRKHRIEVGRGLRQKLPDRLARQILEELVTPQFRAGRPDLGLAAGVEALIGAVGGQRRGARASAGASGDASASESSWVHWAVIGLVVPAVIAAVTFALLRSGERPKTQTRGTAGATPAGSGAGATLGSSGEWDSRQFATMQAVARGPVPPTRRRIDVADTLESGALDDTFEGLSAYAQGDTQEASYASASGSSSSYGSGSSSFTSGGGSFDGGGSSGSW